MAPARVTVRRWSTVLVDVVIVAALVGASVWYGRFAFLNAASPPDYYYLSPSVMVAAGQGFVAPVPEPGSPLDDFLVRRTETLDVRDAIPQALAEPEAFHSATRYLLITVGWWWRLWGISWDHVAGVAAALHVMAVLGAYATFRLFLPLALSALGALWICTSTLQLAFVPHVRDYSKAAFILAALPLVVALALRTPSRTALLGAAAGFGFLIGVGFGFRMDVAVMVPLAIGAIVLFRGRRPWTDLREKAVAVAVLVICLALPAWPVVSQQSRGGSNAIHVVLLGYADTFDVGLQVAPSVYRFVPFYSDSYIALMVNGHAGPTANAHLSFPSPEYDQASRHLWLNIMRQFPADMYGRAAAASNVVMNLVFRSPDPTFLAAPPPARDAAVAIYTFLHRFDGLGIWLGIGLVLSASVVSIRHGLFVALLLLALAGYPSLQFSDRHYFHVQVVPVFALLTLAGLAASATSFITDRRRHGREVPSLRVCVQGRTARRLGAGSLIVMSLTVIPLMGLRLWQAPHVERVISGALRGARTPVHVGWEEVGNGGWLARWPQMHQEGGGVRRPVRMDYYLLEFATSDRLPLAVALRYESTSAGTDFSRVLSVAPVPGINRIGFAALTLEGESSFIGVEVGEHAKASLIGAYRLARAPAGLPLDLLLPSDWNARPLTQRLALEAGWTSQPSPAGPTVVCATGPGCRGLMNMVDRLGTMDSTIVNGLELLAPMARVAEGTLEVAGMVETSSSYLAQWPEHRVPTGSAFVAEGQLAQSGGAMFGLLKDAAWAQQAFVFIPGRFVVIVPVPIAGDYTPMVTNAMAAGQRSNRLTVSKAAFMEPGAP